jgi:parvulin-like peptidyl-prolyl isomerase
MLSDALQNLILDQAIAAIDPSAAERQHWSEQFLTDQSYQNWLQQQQVTPEVLQAWLDRELRIRKFQQQQWGKKVASYFLQQKSQRDQVVCSLIYLKDRDLAQELYFRIVEDEQTFAEVAMAYSQGPGAEFGGLTGPIALGQLHPNLAKMLYGGRPNQLWKPTPIDQWIMIVQLETWLPVQFDESMRQTLLNEQLEAWLQDQIKQRFPAE